MPLGLKRYQTSGHFHAINFSCYDRRPYLATPAARDLFEHSLEKTRLKYDLHIFGYVVMPEHAHLLVSEPKHEPLSKAIQSLKLSVSKQSPQRPFWHDRYYDFNVITGDKHTEKLRYLHRNPVARGLVKKPEDWLHSSYQTYLTRTQRTVTITLPSF
jgi:putative transposase